MLKHALLLQVYEALEQQADAMRNAGRPPEYPWLAALMALVNAAGRTGQRGDKLIGLTEPSLFVEAMARHVPSIINDCCQQARQGISTQVPKALGAEGFTPIDYDTANAVCTRCQTRGSHWCVTCNRSPRDMERQTGGYC